MIFYLKILRFHNNASHSYWGYLTDEPSPAASSPSLSFFKFEENARSLEMFFQQHPNDIIVTFDGEYIFGRYPHLFSSNIIALDILFYLSNMQKFTISNFNYAYKINHTESNPLPMHDHRSVAPRDMLSHNAIEDYLHSYCSLMVKFQKSESSERFVEGITDDEKVQSFYENVQLHICENVYYFNSKPINFDMTIKSTSKLYNRYEDYITKIRRLGNKMYPNYYALAVVTGRLGFFGELNPMILPKEIRALIVPENDFVVSFDADNAEPRMVFELSDTELEYDDVYEGIMDVMGDETMDREHAKSLWFNFVYGNRSVKQTMDVRRMEKVFPEIASFIDRLVVRGRRELVVHNYFGRRLPKVSENEYKIVNHYIQSTFSDFFQLVVRQIIKQMKKEQLQSKVICTIQDEFLLDIKESEQEIIMKSIQKSVNVVCDRHGLSQDVIRFGSTILNVK